MRVVIYYGPEEGLLADEVYALLHKRTDGVEPFSIETEYDDSEDPI